MNEKEKILNMVAEGKISVEEGEKLLKAIGAKGEQQEAEAAPVTELIEIGGSSSKEKSSRGKVIIDIRSAKGENIKVNVPLKLAGLASKMIPKDRLDEVEKEGYNIREMLSNLTGMIEEIDEDIVNISSSNGDRIRIYVDR